MITNQEKRDAIMYSLKSDPTVWERGRIIRLYIKAFTHKTVHIFYDPEVPGMEQMYREAKEFFANQQKELL